MQFILLQSNDVAQQQKNLNSVQYFPFRGKSQKKCEIKDKSNFKYSLDILLERAKKNPIENRFVNRKLKVYRNKNTFFTETSSPFY